MKLGKPQSFNSRATIFWPKLLVTIIFRVIAIIPAYAVPRTETLECGLPDGSKFILTAQHDWDPLSIVFPVTQRTIQEPFRIKFQRKSRWPKISFPKVSESYRPIDDVGAANDICRGFGLVNGVPYAGVTNYLPVNERKFRKTLFDSKLRLSPTLTEQPSMVREQLRVLDAAPSTRALKTTGRYFVCETALENPEMIIVAVYQSRSADKGKTWADPVVTTNAEIFKIGVRLNDQVFLARATRINGKEIKTEFRNKAIPKGSQKELE